MRKSLYSFALAALISSAVVALGVSHAQQGSGSPSLRIIGVEGNEISVTAEDWAKLPRASVKVVERGGAEVTFEGVPGHELLKLVGAPSGHDLRGQQLSLYVLAEASDGYQVVYALAEFDASFTDGLILVADRKNGTALGPDEGPLRMVVPWEKRPARWARWVRVLRLRMAP
jgi:DMSO/TMAO reductase YedYZ molybdopterin-dependent catalytic subunit